MCYLYLDWYRCAILISTGVLVLLPACEGNYAEMSVLNVKSIKITNGENKNNFPLQVSPKGGGDDTFCKLEGSTLYTVWELEESTCCSLGTGG